MYSLQKLLPKQPVPKPGAFSLHSKPNQSVDNSMNRSQESKITKSVDVNQQSLVQLQMQMQLLKQQKTPSKYKSERNLRKPETTKPELITIIENAKIPKRQVPSPKKMIHTPKQKSNRKLNFNQVTPPPKQCDQDTLFLNSSNQMANMIIENILNKDEYYEKIRMENQELREGMHTSQQQVVELKKRLATQENNVKELTTNLNQERTRYQGELLKINEKIGMMKNMQTNLQMEQKKNELLTKQLQDQINVNSIIKTFIAENTMQCIEFLNYFHKTIQQFKPSQAYQSIITLFKLSTSIILDTISKTQQLNLPALKNCQLPEEFDLNGFFEEIERISKNTLESPELSFRQKSHSLSQVHKPTQSSKNVSLQDQFNTFLESSDPITIPDDLQSQLGSPYFTNLEKPIKLQERLKLEKEKERKRDQMPLQMNHGQSKQRARTDAQDQPQQQNKQLQNFQSFNQANLQHISLVQDHSENDTLQYDSLIKELQNDKQRNNLNHSQSNNNNINNKDRSTSVRTLKYLDQQVMKESEKQQQQQLKKNKENIQNNNQYVLAKYDYKAQKDVDLTFKKGDHIKLLKKTNNGWWFGELDGQTGYFPHNFVQLVD